MSGIASLFGIPALDNTYGAVLMGSNLSLILYGLNLHQAFQYLRNFPNDSIFVKTIVWSVLALETMNSAFCMHITYLHLVTNYFNPLQLTFAGWSLDIMPIAAGLSIIASQCFFIRRVYKLGGIQRFVAIFGIIMLTTELAFCLAATIEAFLQPSFEAYQSVTWLISAAFGIIVLTDFVLTTSLILALRRSRTGLKSTDSLVDIIVLYAITTGLVTTIVNLVAFFFALILPENLIYVGINIVAGKLYVTSLFAALNSRTSLAKQAVAWTVYGTGGTVIGTKSTIPEMTWRVRQPAQETSFSGTSMLDLTASKAPGLGELADEGIGAIATGRSVQGEVYEMRPVANVV